jgi:hypothetical protein
MFTIDTSRTRQTVRAEAAPKTVQSLDNVFINLFIRVGSAVKVITKVNILRQVPIY